VAEPGADATTKAGILERIEDSGLRADDPRLAKAVRAVRDHPKPELGPEAFRRAIQPSALLVEKALERDLVVPNFAAFGSDVRRLFGESERNRQGDVAKYIPQLGRVDPELFGLGLCTVDGQRIKLGDAERAFSVQSSTKPVTYCLALEEHGDDIVHRHVGREPSGKSFNELALNPRGLPHNPMVNAGAIMSTSLIRAGEHLSDRFEYVLDMWTRLTGGTQPGFSNATYLSEKSTADRNFALGYSMREQGAFPDGTDLQETLEFYFQLCSLELSVDAFSVVAATLANGGICPITGDPVLKPSTVQKCLSLMYSCGMYDFSGEWAFRVGLPAKSGVSGIVLVVVPNVLGLAIWAPRLDEHGNSVRGVDFCERLVREFNFHNYDNLVGGAHGKKDPRREASRQGRRRVVDLCWAASEGDLDGLRRLVAEGGDPGAADYDGRTPLHLAAAEGRAEVVTYLLGIGVDRDPRDRWGKTPVDDATRGGHADVSRTLRRRT
jgi:glutaminase